MLRFLALVVSVAAGVALGLAATYALLKRGPPFGVVRSGPWTAWPTSGTAGADPYMRAVAARDGRIPLAAAAGLRFVAGTDAAGQSLDGNCLYEIGGPTPAAQYWTVTVLGLDGRPRPAPEARAGFTATELIRGADGAFTIVLSRQARPGNWLPTRGSGPFLLMLSLYETPLGTALANGVLVPGLPTIDRTSCP